MTKAMTFNVAPAEHSSNKWGGEEFQPPGSFGIRHIQCTMLFFACALSYAMRVNLSLAIVAMTDKKLNPYSDTYDWDEQTISLVLSSFFLGYIITQVPGGVLAQRFGPKFLLFFALLLSSVLAVLTPWITSLGGWKFICALRFLQGQCQGVLFPCTHTMLSKWAPVKERGRLTTYCYSGSQFGTAIMLGSSGLLASSSLGWPSIFYTSGTLGIIWSILWFLLGANSPSDHKTITIEEKLYIGGSSSTSSEQSDEDHKIKLKTPWLKMFTSLPFISLIIVHSVNNWGFWTLLTEMPTYMKNILEQDIKSNALLSALPYFVMWLMSYFFSFLADVLARKQCISLSVSRKLFNSIGLWVPMMALIALAYTKKNNTGLAIGLLILAVGINGATYLGYHVNHIDLAPNHAGTMMGITNCAANIMSTIAPLAVGLVVTDVKDRTQWRIVFFIAAGFYLFGNLLFVTFGRTNVQSWNSSDPATSITSKTNGTSNQDIESRN